jgi:hypothetical protein
MHLPTLEGEFVILLLGSRVEVLPAVPSNAAKIAVITLNWVDLLLLACPKVGTEEDERVGWTRDLGFALLCLPLFRLRRRRRGQ